MPKKEDLFKAQRFLIIQTAYIGDVVLATSLIEKLSSINSNWQLDILVRKGNESLLENNPHLHTIHIWNKKHKKLKNLFELLRVIRATQYDYVINLHRFLSSGLLTLFSGGDITIGFDKNPLSLLFKQVVPYHSGAGIHEIDRNHKLIKKITDGDVVFPKMYPSSADYEKVKGYKNGPYYCLAPGSVWFTKQYPKEHWINLINKSKYPVYLLGGQEDESLCHYILKHSKPGGSENLSGKLSFLETAALMKDAEMNFVNDSAPLHFASAMNAPVTAFFCSTVPDFGFGPLSRNSKIMQSDKSLACRPCGLHGHKKCPMGHFECAHTIAEVEM